MRCIVTARFFLLYLPRNLNATLKAPEALFLFLMASHCRMCVHSSRTYFGVVAAIQTLAIIFNFNRQSYEKTKHRQNNRENEYMSWFGRHLRVASLLLANETRRRERGRRKNIGI